MSELERFDELDPWRILLNRSGFRSRLQIYEIAQKWDCDIGRVVYIVRKQILNHIFFDKVQEIRESEEYTALQVTRADVAEIYDAVRNLNIPAARTERSGKDGTRYHLQIGLRARAKKIRKLRWWSDIEPELESVYDLKDKIINTINRLTNGENAKLRE